MKVTRIIKNQSNINSDRLMAIVAMILSPQCYAKLQVCI